MNILQYDLLTKYNFFEVFTAAQVVLMCCHLSSLAETDASQQMCLPCWF